MLSSQHTQMGEWLDELSLIDEEVRLQLEPLSDEQWRWRPGECRWSIGECVQHLALTTSLMLGRVKPALERARAEGKTGDEPYRYGAVGGWFVRMMEQPGKRPMPSPSNFVPQSALPKAAVRNAFHHAQEDLRQTMAGAAGLALDRIKAPSSARGAWWLRLNVAAWFAATLAHERRHLAQAGRVRTAPGFPGLPPAPGSFQR